MIGKWLFEKLRARVLLGVLVLVRLSPTVGGVLTVYYIHLNARLPPVILREFIGAVLLTCGLAITSSFLIQYLRTRHARRALGLLFGGQPVTPLVGQAAGREIVTLAVREFLTMAVLGTLIVAVPCLVYLGMFCDAGYRIVAHVAIGAFLGVVTTMTVSYFAVDALLQPVLRFFFERKVPIDFDAIRQVRVRTKLMTTFALTILVTVVMIGNLANSRAVEIAGQTGAVAETIRSLQAHTLAISTVAVALAILLSFALARSITRPLDDMMRAMATVESGDLSGRVVAVGNDELGALGRGFNRMIDQLDKKTAEIYDLNRSLERRVQERTEELRKQNAVVVEQSVELARQRTEVDLKNRELEKANSLKSEFLANMSHELRTPLNSIIGYTDIVIGANESVLSPKHVRNLNNALESAQELLELINNILDLSKIEAGKMEVFIESFETAPLVDAVLATAQVLLKDDSPVKLVADVSDDVPLLTSDHSKLRQIILNLVSNAVKFTEKGEIRVKATRLGEQVRIAVHDTGPGMRPEDLELIWQEFRQLDGSSTRSHGGTGLGLSIVRKLTHLLGGEVAVDSTLGQGSTFAIVLPIVHSGEAVLKRAQARRQARRAEAASLFGRADDDSKPPVGQRTVLSIDDDPDTVIFLKEFLATSGYSVIGAFEANDGIRLAKELRPFAVLLDIMMPGKDGWETIRELKSDPATADLPIVVLSMIENKNLAFSLGVTDYLVKPVDRQSILQVLDRVSVTPVHDILIVDDEESAREILTEVLTNEGYVVRAASSGKEAVAMVGERPPDLVLLDLMMPEMDGFEVLSVLRADAKFREIPVVVVTAKTLTREDRERLQSGIVAVIEKGRMRREDILAGLLRVFERLQKMRARSAPPVSPATPAPNGQPEVQT